MRATYQEVSFYSEPLSILAGNAVQNLSAGT